MAKRTRRERRLETNKQNLFSPKTALVESPTAEEISSPTFSEEFVSAPAKSTQAAVVNNRKFAAVNFAQEYYYEYSELSKILVITVILFVVMIGLSFVI
jgi:hypothetical protein